MFCSYPIVQNTTCAMLYNMQSKVIGQLQESSQPVRSEKTPNRPLKLQELNQEHPLLQSGELALLYKLQQGATHSVADVRIIPATAEENFYKLNNLPEQFAKLFKKVDLSDPDEDDIEDIAPEAQALFKKHYLLDEFIDVFYEAIEPLDTKLTIRQLYTDSDAVVTELSATRGRPLLLKLKELWAMDWGFDAIFKRIQATGKFGLEARALIIHTANYEASSTEQNQDIAEALGISKLTTYQDENGAVLKIVKLQLEPS